MYVTSGVVTVRLPATMRSSKIPIWTNPGNPAQAELAGARKGRIDGRGANHVAVGVVHDVPQIVEAG